MPMPMMVADEIRAVVETAVRIRAFEKQLLDLFRDGLLSGTVHTCIGQEFCAAALHPHLRRGVDAFFATHRGHGHYLAYGGPEDALLAELMGRAGALCLGRGGTQNLCFQRFFSGGIQGGCAPIATGYAWALRRRGGGAIAVAQIGDGTLGEGTLYEAFTFAALLGAPVLFLLEYNGWAQSTDVRTTTPGDVLQRAAGFGLDGDWIKDDDPDRLQDHLGRVVADVRRGKPFLQVVETRRLMAHSKGDDNRPGDLVAALWREDPLGVLLDADESLRSLAGEAEESLRRVVASVRELPALEYPGDLALPASRERVESRRIRSDGGLRDDYGKISEELNAALHAILAEDDDVILLGEDLLDPYGGAFKVSRGLSSRFPDQVFSTPIAEAAIAGVANGLALAGMRPIVEIMFADFATLATDQLVNFAAKFHAMYGGKVTCPITIRLVSGGGRGYGPTHSQSLECLFLGIPGLRVIAVSHRHDPGRLLSHVVLRDEAPTVFVENKLLYASRPATRPPLDLEDRETARADGNYPPLHYIPARGEADVTLVTYGGMAVVAEQAMQRLIAEYETRFEYLILTQLWPLDVVEIADSVRRTRRLVVLEENSPDYSVAAAVISGVAQRVPGGFACRAVGARPAPLPSVRHLEDEVLPSVGRVVEAVASIL
jgi:2-oxoisovalerate dehydrogenase E1 component